MAGFYENIWKYLDFTPEVQQNILTWLRMVEGRYEISLSQGGCLKMELSEIFRKESKDCWQYLK